MNTIHLGGGEEFFKKSDQTVAFSRGFREWLMQPMPEFRGKTGVDRLLFPELLNELLYFAKKQTQMNNLRNYLHRTGTTPEGSKSAQISECCSEKQPATTMNKLTFEGIEYDLIKIDTTHFGSQQKLPLSERKNTFAKMTFGFPPESKRYYVYESIKIGDQYFAIRSLDNTRFDEKTLKEKGWIFQSQFGSGKLYHKGFDGSAWFTLLFEGESYITITRVRKEGQEKLVKFQGAIFNEKDFNNICKFLNIQ